MDSTISRSRTKSSRRMNGHCKSAGQHRSWAGIPVIYLGRLADTGERQVVIGEPCSECDYGRVFLNCGVLRCNTCQHPVGELRQLVDDTFSAARAIELLEADLHE